MQLILAKIATAQALQAGIPFSSLETGHTYHAVDLPRLVREYTQWFTLTPAQEADYRELTLRH